MINVIDDIMRLKEEKKVSKSEIYGEFKFGLKVKRQKVSNH